MARLLPDAWHFNRGNFDLIEGGALPYVNTVYLCAGVNGTAKCALDPVGSFRANVDGTVGVAKHYRDIEHGFVVWISSDIIEWGAGAYADQKRTTETILRTMPNVGIIRPFRITDKNMDHFCSQMIEMGRDHIRGPVRYEYQG